MNKNELYGKLFVQDRYFTIAIRKKTKGSVIEDRKFTADYVVPANRQRWCADPMLIDADGKTYLFYEAVIGDKGHIEVAEVHEDCSLSEPCIILKDDCHYSYPFVFHYNKTWYMIPESSASSEVRLYKATDFPEKWELYRVLLHEKAVDTTIFWQDGKCYLLTFFLVEGSERVVPHAYQWNLEQNIAELKEIEWEQFDELKVRGAGQVFSHHDALYRPAQVSQEQRYGDAVAFFRLKAGKKYREKEFFELRAEDLKIKGYHVDGLHTYGQSDYFEVIDVRCAVVDHLKAVKKFTGKLSRR